MNARSSMWTHVLDLDTRVSTPAGDYRVSVEGEQRADGTWAGRIVFRGADTRSTGQETSQPDRAALEYWATGLEPVYLDGAFSRAR